MSLLTVDDVILYTGGRLADDDETERMLAAALAAARRYCGWHVTPILDEELVVDGPGRYVLSLPSLQLLDVTELVEDGVTLDVTKVRWSTPKGQVYKENGCRWTGQWHSIEASITHGFEDAPDFYEAVLSMIDRASRGSTSTSSGEVTREKVGIYEVSYGSVSGSSSGSVASSGLSALEKLKLDSYRILPEP